MPQRASLNLLLLVSSWAVSLALSVPPLSPAGNNKHKLHRRGMVLGSVSPPPSASSSSLSSSSSPLSGVSSALWRLRGGRVSSSPTSSSSPEEAVRPAQSSPLSEEDDAAVSAAVRSSLLEGINQQQQQQQPNQPNQPTQNQQKGSEVLAMPGGGAVAATPDASSSRSGGGGVLGRLANLWGVVGVAYILFNPIKRLLPIAIKPFEAAGAAGAVGVGEEFVLSMPFGWAAYAAFACFMGYTEGYKAFQKKFSPMVRPQ
jgi:hypothetical protein